MNKDIAAGPGIPELPVSAEKLRSSLARLSKAMHPQTPEEIAPMNYPDLLQNERERYEAISSIEKEAAGIPALRQVLFPIYGAARAWSVQFRKAVIEVDSSCMNFTYWHEYTPGWDGPRIDCP